MLIVCLALALPSYLEPSAVEGSRAWPEESEEGLQDGERGGSSDALLGRLAFVQGGDLWVMEVPSGETRRLTDDGSNDRPLWSLSGEWIAFRKRAHRRADDLWVMRSSGADRRLVATIPRTTPLQFAWSPVKDVLAYIHDGLWALQPDEVEVQAVVPPTDRPGGDRFGTFAWSPDGEWLAYERFNRGPGEMRPRLQGIFRIRADGSDDTPVYLNPDPLATQSYLAGWSPDGDLILFWRTCCMSASALADGPPLMVVPATGGEPSPLSPGVLFRYPPDVLASSPGSGRLAVVEGGRREVWEEKAIRVFVYGSDYSNVISEPDRADFFPHWSPDGITLAYASGPLPDEAPSEGDNRQRALEQRRIWTIRQDESRGRQLTDQEGFRDERPRWVGDGEHILFARLAGERPQLWLMRADGSDQQLLVDDLGPVGGRPVPVWFGYYGYIEWYRYYDWWQGDRTRLQAGPVGTG